MKNLKSLKGAKSLSKKEQQEINGGQPVLLNCSNTGYCPPGFCCKGGHCIDDTPVNGTIPACDPLP